MEITPITSLRAELGEGPFWHEGAIYWTDILEKKIYRYFPAEDKREEMMLGSYVGAFAPKQNGGFVLAMKEGFATLSEFGGIVTKIINPESDKPNNRFNDGKCDSAGRFWAGTMDMNISKNQGALYMLDSNLKMYKKYSPVTISNGICWSLDNKQMYYIDTPTQEVVVFDFDLETGEINNPKTLVAIEKEKGSPDGMTIDANGCLWVALWGGGAVVCYDPKSNKFVHKIETPASQVSSCAFGGKNLNELYVTSAKTGLSGEQLEREPLAGATFKIKPDVVGLPTNSFKRL